MMIAPPPLPIVWAILLSLALPAALLALSHGPLKIALAGQRFAAAWASLLVCWLILAISTATPDARLADYAAGLMIVGAAIPLSFMCWSVLCWGVTLNMLVCLGAAREPVSLAQWERGYAGRAGFAHLAGNRTGLLFRTGLATPATGEGSIRLTWPGQVVAAMLSLLMRIFSIRP